MGTVARGYFSNVSGRPTMRQPARGSTATVTRDVASVVGDVHARVGELARLRKEAQTNFARLRRLRAGLLTTWARPAPPGPGAVSRPRSSPPIEVDQLHADYVVSRDERLRDRLLAIYDDFALRLARHFPSRREAAEDLAQVARIGLLHAVDRFDPHRGRPFTSFARATIEGELKRHIRDRTWAMRVPRSLQEHYLVMVRTVDDLTQELGRSPLIAEVAERSGLTEEQVLEAMELGGSQRPASLDVPPRDGQSRAFEPATEDEALAGVEARSAVTALLARLPDRERHVLELRFHEGLTQSEIADKIGVSQMYVSRLLARTLARLRPVARAG